MSRPLAIGLAQITGELYTAEENRRLSVRAATELFDRGARLVVLPELIVPGYGTDRSRLEGLAETLDGPTVTAWAEVAASAGGYVVGGFCEVSDDRLYNSAVLVGPEGLVLSYRKLHLFGEEKSAFAAGDAGLPVAQTPIGVIGLCICYDLRFVETVRALSLKGAELICVPTAWIPGFNKRRWDAEGYCPQARATLVQADLDQVFIACASQAGGAGDFLGSSVLCDPYGTAVIGPLPGTEDELALATVDLDLASRAHERQAGVTPRADRRTDVYGLAIAGEVL
jgi:N-carbamoylputrescine amidase